MNVDLINTDRASFILSSFSAVIVIIAVVYFLYKWMLPSVRCSNIQAAFPNGSQTLTTREKGPISKYYIKSAYNCCSLGNYANDYVGTCILTTILKQGVRFLDFEIYSIGDLPVVATSITPSYHDKETYNSIPFEQVLYLLADQAFTGDVAPNSGDPLFLHLRIHSNNVKMFTALNRMLSDIKTVYNGQVSNKTTLTELMGKTVIIVNSKNKAYISQGLAHNMISGTSDFNVYDYDSIRTMSTIELAEMKKPKKMTMMLPSHTSTNPDNINFAKVIDMNCNIIAMRYQKNDQQLANYNSIFAESAFIPKDGLQLETEPPSA
jgi:hypothetical protein